MRLKQAVNAALMRTTGYQLRRPEPPGRGRVALREGDRLLEAPAFILCTVRSGSTLLRVLLNSHSRIHSPHEMHLRDISVQVKEGYPEKALAELGLDATQLRYLLWDRLLHRQLTQAGKSVLVNKTPNDVFIVDRILECWPDARFIYLLRHPAAIAASRQAARPQDSPERNAEVVLRYGSAVQSARRAHPGITVRYEDLATDPEAETRRVCDFLAVEWEPQMLEYGRFRHGAYRAGLGDWSERIKSGRIQPPASPPAEIPPQLVGLARDWGYLGQDGAGESRPAEVHLSE